MRISIYRAHSTCSWWHRLTCRRCREVHKINVNKGGC